MRKNCRQPESCVAGARGPCRLCSDLSAHRERMKKLHADPEFAAAHRERGRERMKKLNADPEFAAKLKEAVCVHWTPEMDEALVELRAAGVPILECAEQIGVSTPVCRKRADELGLPVRSRRAA